MVRTVRSCQDCKRQYVSQGGVLLCNECDRKRRRSFVVDHPISNNGGGTFTSDICFICGADLSKVKHRINHIKRCSKKHSMSGRDVRCNETIPQSDSGDNKETNITSTANSNNPYSKENDWHGDANALLQLTKSSIATDTSNTSKQTQTSLTDFLILPARNLNNVLMAASRRLSKEHQLISAQKQNKRVSSNDNDINSTQNKRGRWSKKDYSNYSCPQYKKIPGTDFVVDGFQYAKQSLTQNYFLTHFHSDHYGGIDSRWSAGVIYCSIPTANLVNQQLRVDKKYIHPIPMNTPTVIESRGKPITVTLLDANHCPGAAMILFEIGQRKRKILHVGDFRWNRDSMLRYPQLRAIASQQEHLDELFLDTTYCDPKHSLPSQNETIRAVLETFDKQRKTGHRTLHLFGAYTIGKERMYMSIAEHFGMKVFVDSARYRILSALEWPNERMNLLTTNKEETCIWVVPLGHINFKRLFSEDYLTKANTKPFVPVYTHICGYRPTGWSLSSKPSAGHVSTRKSGNFIVHSIPYSEHSSFPELVDCLECLKPARIVPTVAASKSQEQIAKLLKGLRMKQTELVLKNGNED